MSLMQFKELPYGAMFKLDNAVWCKMADTLAHLDGVGGAPKEFEAIDLVEVQEEPVDKTCLISLHNLHGWDLDTKMLNHVLGKVVARHAPQATMVNIYPSERVPADAPVWKNPGWLEWVINIHYRGGGDLSIHCIQRKTDGPYETHT